MPVTLQPVFEALGFPTAKQQRGLVKLLQAASAFGDVQGVNGVLTDQQCDAILSHVTFNDTQQALKLLHEITQEHLIRPEGMERYDCSDSNLFMKHRSELMAALADTGMLAEKKPAKMHYDSVLLLGSMEEEVSHRFDKLKELWDQGIRFDKIVLLGSQRQLSGRYEQSAGTVGANGERIQNEMQMMETYYYAKSTAWPPEMQNVRIFEVNTFNKPCGKRANTQDTIKAWMKTNPHGTDALVISTQPYVHYQDAAVKSAVPDSMHIDTVGGSAPENIKISVALDSFARQVDVNYEKTLQKLQSQPNILKTPVVSLKTSLIKTKPGAYQWHSDGDANGVTSTRHLNVNTWDARVQGLLVVHKCFARDANGNVLNGSDGKPQFEYFVADGHHRLELAKRLNVDEVNVMVLSEEQGYTVKDVKIVAAYINFTQSLKETSREMADAARVFKEARSGDVHVELLPSLQMDKSNLRMAYTMSKLSDKVLDQVQKEKIEPKIAEKLAELVPDDVAKQEAVIKVISQKLQQNYAIPGESKATSVNVNMTAMADEKEMAQIAGFVAKLALEGASMGRTV